MTWIVQLLEQRRTYGPIRDIDVAYDFARYLTAEVDPAVVLPYDPAYDDNLVDPVRDLLTWRTHTLRNLPPDVGPGEDVTALAAIRHANRDSALIFVAVTEWLTGANPDDDIPAAADQMLAHVAATAHRGRVLLAAEAADLDRIRTIGDTPS